MRADWLLDDKHQTGLDFLRDLMNLQSRTIFETDYVSIVIQFLYSRFREAIISTKLPLYIFHLFAVLLMIVCEEGIRDAKAEQNLFSRMNGEEAGPSVWRIFAPIANVAALIITLLNLLEFIS